MSVNACGCKCICVFLFLSSSNFSYSCDTILSTAAEEEMFVLLTAAAMSHLGVEGMVGGL